MAEDGEGNSAAQTGLKLANQFTPPAAKIGCLMGALLAITAVMFFSIGLNSPGVDEAAADTNFRTAGELSSKVPPNLATLFKEAAAQFDLDPAIIAGIYLTEHHTDSFGKDIASLDATQANCTKNSSGAQGPMQIIDSTWTGVSKKLISKGIENPDRCKWRDAIWGGAAVIRGKITRNGGQSDAISACGITSSNDTPNYSDNCIRKIGRAYCGACDGPACGTNGYNYCDQTLRHYNISRSGVAMDIPWPIIEKGVLCVAK